MNWFPYQMLSPVTSHLGWLTKAALVSSRQSVSAAFVSVGSKMPRTLRRMELPPTKTVTVYRNGDAFYSGRKVVVNRRQVSTFDNFLTSLTKKIDAPFGAVRRLYTPTQGHRIQDLDDLMHGSGYVAAGNEPFKTLDYYGITTTRPQNKIHKQILPVAHSRIVASSRWRRVTDDTCTINVFKNGELLVPPARILIPKHTRKSWENVLSMVTEKVYLRTGAVYRLCRLDGQPVSGPTELENNHHYVAVGAEKFRPLPYEQCVPSKNLVWENNTPDGQDIQSDNGKRKAQKNKVFFKEDLENAARGHMKQHTANTESFKQQKQVSSIPAFFTVGGSSVFDAQNKRSETAGAAEVQEDRQVKVDLPIDQVEAKVIEEELEDLNGSSPNDDSHIISYLQPKEEDKEREDRFSRIRSRMSRFFKGKMKS